MHQKESVACEFGVALDINRNKFSYGKIATVDTVRYVGNKKKYKQIDGMKRRKRNCKKHLYHVYTAFDRGVRRGTILTSLLI